MFADSQDQIVEGSMKPSLLPSFFAGLALGAAAMFLLDPVQGRTRRAKIGQKGIRAKNETLKYGGKIARDMRNRAQGTIAELNRGFGEDGLQGQIQAALDKIQDAKNVIFRVANGEVTLSGVIPENVSKSVISVVKAIPGVRNVIQNFGSQDQSMNRGTSPSKGVENTEAGRQYIQ